MKTKLVYLEDTYVFTSSAKFLELRTNEKGTAVILDQTIFYPQGGGQPTDAGYIKSVDAVFKVTFVGLDSEGVVWHFGDFEKGEFSPHEEVSLEIDAEKRVLHARIHSAGHLIDCAVQGMNIGIVPYKGFHFVEGPYLEGEGTVEDIETFKVRLEERVNKLISENLAMNRENVSEEDAKERGISAPPGKSVRIVGFEGHKPCGCGGTHVTNSSDIGSITIRKVSSKKGKTKISYAVA